MSSKFTRQQIWQHNGFQGHVAMAARGMDSIMRSHTATPAAKDLAAEIGSKLFELSDLLRQRDEDTAA